MSSDIELHLKRRKQEKTIELGMDVVNDLLKEGDKNKLWSAFVDVVEDAQYIHDKRWLKVIANWLPQNSRRDIYDGGLEFTEAVLWYPLIQAINEIDDTKDVTFTISRYKANLLWERLKEPKFKMMASTPAWIEFVLMFQIAYGETFEGEEKK